MSKRLYTHRYKDEAKYGTLSSICKHRYDNGRISQEAIKLALSQPDLSKSYFDKFNRKPIR